MLLLIALEMVFERRTDRRSRSADELKRVGGPDDISVFPLAIPLLSGPGAITSIMLLMARHEGDLAAQAVVVGVLLVVMALCVAIFLCVEPLERLLGPTLVHVVSRLLGILLAALAVQYVFDGLRDAFDHRRRLRRYASSCAEPGGSRRSRSSRSAEAPNRKVFGRGPGGSISCSAR